MEEEIFLRQSQGYKSGDKVYKLKKSLYGLKQAARVWNITLHQHLSKIGFEQNEIDKCIYVLREHDKLCYLIVHVDDLLFAANSEALITSVASKISHKFELKNLGQAIHYLGIDITRDSSGNFFLSQSRYIDKIVSSASLKDAKLSKYPVDTGYFKLSDNNFLETNHEYRRLIGMLLYLTTHSHPDVAASVSILSQKVSKPRIVDLNEVKRLIRYLKTTAHVKLKLSNKSHEQNLYAFSDANWAECLHTRKSNSGYACFINGVMVSWCCRKQNLITLSSTEAEYVALFETSKEIIWLNNLVKFFCVQNNPILIFTDSQSCLKMISNEKFSNRTKHIDIKYHHVKNCVSKNFADLFTKPLGPTKIKHLCDLAGLIDDVTPSRGTVGERRYNGYNISVST